MQLMVLVGFKDPTISSYTIMESRDEMEDELNAADLSLQFYFGMVNNLTFKPVEVPPKYGRFRLYNQIMDNREKDDHYVKEIEITDTTHLEGQDI